MSKKDLRVFMRESSKTEEIVSVPAPPSFTDADGKPVMLEIKVLSSDKIHKINENYRKRSIAVDKKGNPYIVNGEVAFRTERDYAKATGHILAEALVYPDLKDPELMKFYECHDITEMAMKVFSKTDEYTQVNQAVMSVLGLSSEPPSEDEKSDTLEEIKN